MILAVTGGRDFTDREMVDSAMRKWIVPGDSQSLIIHGGARGADTLVDKWGRSNGVHAARVDALWDWFGKPAGHWRNKAMLLLRPELLLAFPGGKGTADAIKTAEELGIQVRRAE